MDVLRNPVVLLELAALAAVMALVDNVALRVALGTLLAALVAVSGLTRPSVEGAPSGLPERREDHLFRHWVNHLIRKAREFHTVCQAVKEERVNLAVGQLKIQQIEQELQSLLGQIAEAAKPQQMKGHSSRRPSPGKAKPGSESQHFDTQVEEYGEATE